MLANCHIDRIDCAQVCLVQHAIICTYCVKAKAQSKYIGAICHCIRLGPGGSIVAACVGRDRMADRIGRQVCTLERSRLFDKQTMSRLLDESKP